MSLLEYIRAWCYLCSEQLFQQVSQKLRRFEYVYLHSLTHLLINEIPIIIRTAPTIKRHSEDGMSIARITPMPRNRISGPNFLHLLK